MPKPYVQVTLRLPPELHAWLVEQATKHRFDTAALGVSTWIVNILEDREEARGGHEASD